MSTPSPRHTLLAAGLLLLVGLGAFGRSAGFDFVWDDRNLIVDNPHLSRSTTPVRAFSTDFWELTAAPKGTPFYRPLVIVGYWLQHRIFGPSPMGYHVVTMALHLLAALLVLMLGLRLKLPLSAAFMGATLFCVHPAQSVAVGNIASQTDLWATALLLSGLLLWLRTSSWRLLALPLLLAALLAKESAVVGPLLALGLARISPPDTGERRPLPAWLPLLVWLAYTPLRLAAVPLDLGGRLEDSPWYGGLLLLRYLWRIVAPSAQAPVTEVLTPPLTLTLPTLLLVLLLAALLLRWRGKVASTPGFAAAWLLLALLPVAGVLPLGVRFSDLMLHLPLVAVGLAFGWAYGRARAARGMAGRAARWIGVALVATALVLTSGRLERWRDNLTLWRHAVALAPGDPLSRMNLANALRRDGQHEQGCRLLTQTLTLLQRRGIDRHQAADVWIKSHFNLGNCARRSHQPNQAAIHYAEALRRSGGELHQARHNLAITLLEQGRGAEALTEGKELVKRAPGLARHWRLLGVIHARQGRMAAAARALREALRRDPSDAAARAMLQRTRGP